MKYMNQNSLCQSIVNVNEEMEGEVQLFSYFVCMYFKVWMVVYLLLCIKRQYVGT